MNYITLNSYQGYGEIVLNRPNKSNALNTNMLEELVQAIDIIATYAQPIVLLRANGKTFCAGLDLSEVLALAKQNNRECLARMNYLVGDVFAKLTALNKYLVVCLSGNSCGGGVGLVTVADYVIAQTSAQIMFSEISLGLVPGQLYPYVYSKFGAQVMRWFTESRTFTVDEAAMRVLISECVDEVDSRLYRYLRTLEDVNLDAVLLLKQIQLSSLPPIEDNWRRDVADVFAKQAIVAVDKGLLTRFGC